MGRKNIRSVGSSGCLLLVLVAIVVIIILGYNNQSFSQALNLKHSWSGGVKDAIILLKPINIKEEGDKIKADVILSNLTLTWVFTNQVYLPSATAKVPVGGPVYSYLLGPNQSKVLGTVEFQKGSYLQLNAKSPVGIDYQRFGYEDAALLGAVALDLIMRGFFKKELPSNAFDEPLLIGVETGIGSIPHLFYNITSHCSGPLGAFGYAIGRKDISGALEALGKFVICTSKGPIKEKVKDFLKALFSVEVADKWMEKFSTNLVDFLNLPERASLLYIISKYTFSAPPQGWGRIEALEAGVISKLPKTIIDVYNRLGGLSTFEEPILQDYTTPSGLASTGTPYKGVEFSRGGIYESSIGVFAVYGAIYQKYKVIGGPRHYLGLPISNEEGVPKSTFGTTGRISRFERGSIVWLKEKNQTFIVQGGIFDKWASLGYSGGQLGFPTSDEYPYQGGARSDFEGGYITWTSKTGAQVVLKGSPLPISARINNYSASPTKIQVGQTTTFKVAFTNTGNTQWTFGAGISLRRPDGVRIDNLPTQPVKLNPNQQGIATWTYTIDREGSWEVVFGIWKDPAGKDLLTQTGWIKGLVITEAIPSKPTVSIDPQLLAQVQQSQTLWERLNTQASQISYPTPADREAMSQELQRAGKSLQIAEEAAKRGDRTTFQSHITQAQQALNTVSQRLAQIVQRIASPKPAPTNLPPQARITLRSGPNTIYENQILQVTVSSGKTAQVIFSGERSVDPESSPLTYQWFINGQMVNTAREFSFNLGRGSHQILLKVRDNQGLENAVGATVNIIEQGMVIPKPEITSNLRMLEPSPYKAGQIITAEFSIRNSGNSPITFDVLTVGGRLNGQCPNNRCPDFEFRPNVTLPPNGSYTYRGTLKLEAPGNYHFFTAYRTKEGQWNTAIPTLPGVRNTLDISVAPSTVATPPPQPTAPTPPPQPYVTPSITSRIDMVDISPKSVQVGQSVTLRMRFTNTGNTTHTFIVGASLWRPGDYSNPVANFERSVTLSQGQSTEVTWSYQPNVVGNWGYQFAVWKQKPFVSSNLLAKQPSPISFFSVTAPAQAPAPPPKVQTPQAPTIDRPPNVTSFSSFTPEINRGQSVILYFNVMDDIGLNRAELWRADDYAGIGFREIKRVSISGKSYSGSFSDFPPSPDTYRYGVHVVDSSGKWNCERNSQTGFSPGVYGPRQVVVKAPSPPPQTPPVPTPPTSKPPIPTPSPQIISGRIESFSPNYLTKVRVGDQITLSVTFTNTGNTPWSFIAGVSIWDANGRIVGNYSTSLSSFLQPGQSKTVSWVHRVQKTGDYWVQFGLWKAAPFVKENLLDKKPSPAQMLINGR